MGQMIDFIPTDTGNAGRVLAGHLLREIEQDKKVLWFISGGSSIPIAQDAARIISEQHVSHLRVLLVDEKFEDENQAVTNWSQLASSDTFLAKITPRILLKGKSIDGSLCSYRENVEENMQWADYTIGQFGIGDGYHTGGIQSHSNAITDDSLVVYYERGNFQHITVTTKLVSLLDLAFVNSFGKTKKKLVNHFADSTASMVDEPTQVLKSAKRLIVATDATS